jgi:hypothetical protein
MDWVSVNSRVTIKVNSNQLINQKNDRLKLLRVGSTLLCFPSKDDIAFVKQ